MLESCRCFCRALKGWRTVLSNIALSIPLVLEILSITLVPEWRGILPPEYLPYYALTVALVNVWLRYLTTTPVGRRD